MFKYKWIYTYFPLLYRVTTNPNNCTQGKNQAHNAEFWLSNLLLISCYICASTLVLQSAHHQLLAASTLLDLSIFCFLDSSPLTVYFPFIYTDIFKEQQENLAGLTLPGFSHYIYSTYRYSQKNFVFFKLIFNFPVANNWILWYISETAPVLLIPDPAVSC